MFVKTGSGISKEVRPPDN